MKKRIINEEYVCACVLIYNSPSLSLYFSLVEPFFLMCILYINRKILKGKIYLKKPSDDSAGD